MSTRFPPLPEVQPPTLVVPPKIAAAIADLGVREVRVVDEAGAPLGRLRTRAYLEAMRWVAENPPAADVEPTGAVDKEGACSAEELWAYIHRDRSQPWVGENIPDEGPVTVAGPARRDEEGETSRREAA